ncbi:MAG: PilZ domain-containing protein [Bacillales bacterium]|nr:PilZ domain-containing protein [Bacillales bacterium]
MLEIGTILTLKTINEKEPENEELYKCRVVDKGPEVLYVDYPVHIKTNKSRFFMNGTAFNATFVTEKNSVYTFQTKVVGKEKREIPTMIIQDPGEEKYIRIQRRRFVRVETAVDVSVSREGSEEAFTTITKDISAGGAAIKIPKNLELKQKEQLNMLVVLPIKSGEFHYLKLKGEIVRVSDEGPNSTAYIQFAEMTPSERQLLLRFCYERQLLLRKKGLLE